MTRVTSMRSLRALLQDPIGQRMLAIMDAKSLQEIADGIATDDPYGECAYIEAALARLGLSHETAVAAVLFHELWCWHREAAWRKGRLDARNQTDSVVLEGERWLLETEGHATVLISPMTLSLSDTGWIVSYVLRRSVPDRRVILYGEDVAAGDIGFSDADERVAGAGPAAVRSILDTLANGGIFCTHADFVYAGRDTIDVQLFGNPFPISAGFVNVAARPGTMLLPCLLTRGPAGQLICQFFEPVMLTTDEPSEPASQRIWRRQSTALLVGMTLERLVGAAAYQWRLISTLSSESPQRGEHAQVHA